jgi:hypothetical protein
MRTSCPAAWTTARSVIAFGAGTPWMLSNARRLAIGLKPSSAPARIAAVASAGLPRYCVGAMEVEQTTSAY